MTIPKTEHGPKFSDALLPASTSQRRRDAKLLCIDGESFSHHRLDDLVDLLRPDDLLVVNDAATMPSQFVGEVGGSTIQIRLALHLGGTPADVGRWLAISIADAPWYIKTEERPPGLKLKIGDRVRFSETLTAEVVRLIGDDVTSRMFELEFLSSRELFTDLFETGVPIQYAHLNERLEDWDQQTIFSGPAVAVEPPSSAFHFSWELTLALKRRGVEIVSMTHTTGLSTTGDEALDRCLPLPELSMISIGTADAINAARAAGRRVIAMGTGITRALESNAREGRVTDGVFTSTGLLSPYRSLVIVDGLISGLHEPGSSHLKLLSAFVRSDVLVAAYESAAGRGYLGHEYGDVELVLR